LQGKVEQLESELCDRSCDHPGAIRDNDGAVVRDNDYVAIYEPNTPIDNPNRPTAFFNTVAEMLAADSGSFDRALCFNLESVDGVQSEWVMICGIAITPNTDTRLQMDDGQGYVLKSTQL
jgi:hypothetical protein